MSSGLEYFPLAHIARIRGEEEVRAEANESIAGGQHEDSFG